MNNWQPSGVELPVSPLIEIDGAGLSGQEIIAKAILHSYDIRNDDRDFRNNTAQFEQLRGDYAVRSEFPAFTIHFNNVNKNTIGKLKQLGFN